MLLVASLGAEVLLVVGFLNSQRQLGAMRAQLYAAESAIYCGVSAWISLILLLIYPLHVIAPKHPKDKSDGAEGAGPF